MGDEDYEDNNGGIESTGMSRAAKKRAKKKHKQQRSEEVHDSKHQKRDHTDHVTSHQEDDDHLHRKKVAKETDPAAERKRDPSPESNKRHKKPRIGETGKLQLGGVASVNDKMLESGDDNESFASVPSSIVEITPLLLLDGSHAHADVTDMTSRQRANCILNFLLQPSKVTTREFYAEHWERRPLLVQGTGPAHRRRFDGLLSLEGIRDTVRKHPLYYGRDVNVTRYEKDAKGVHRRHTLDPQKVESGKKKKNRSLSDVAEEEDALRDPDSHFVRVESKALWDKYYRDGGCTIRLLCPHQFSDPVHALLSGLELEWGCMVGANAYLTPPGRSQGFAPHYDDIEAFCLQLEGRKRWKVYAPLRKSERLPRASSEDYLPSDLHGVSPVLDVVLSPGDMLYLPRGWIHQACTLPSGEADEDSGRHSLHLTVSAMQQWAWADLLEIAVPEALQALATGDSTLLREGLPRNFLDYMGVVHDDGEDRMPDVLKRRPDEEEEGEDGEDEARRRRWIAARREAFRAEARRRIARVAQEAADLLDAACDQLGLRFTADRLPPAGLPRGEEGSPVEPKVRPESLCRLTRPGIARLALEGGKAVLYHCLDNSRVFHANPVSPLEFELDDAPALEQLLTTVEPRWIGVQDLFHDSLDDKVGVAQALLDEGLLVLRPTS